MDLFDIIGPVMIGPSSSHTAGAARIGRLVRRMLGEPLSAAAIAFHGSFAKTWKGHGTDRAVIGGLMDMDVDDTRLRDSLALAAEEGLRYTFTTVNLQGAHPNTMIIDAIGQSGKSLRAQAASVGGGRVRIQSLDRLEVNFTGEDNTLLIRHRDAPGAIAQVTGLLALAGVNIATMRVFREEEGGNAVMVLELDALPDAETVNALTHLRGVKAVTLFEKR
ncbi:MAG: L-serine ammonia-lyase, iron-sulfur-dependent subunit beta [Firmicutes bacterium]|nr:L-serine ammonia-lyase, iron-sulfur-dependent subunit beta [Bacillota bacterium]